MGFSSASLKCRSAPQDFYQSLFNLDQALARVTCSRALTPNAFFLSQHTQDAFFP